MSTTRPAFILASLACLALGAPRAFGQGETCQEATLVGVGTYNGSTVGATQDGTASCGSSAASPDVWYRFVVAEAGTLRVNTCGSGFDTVLSAHPACPGTLENQIACNDDTNGACGLGSTVTVPSLAAGAEVLLRVSGFNGATGAYALNVAFEAVGSGPNICEQAGVLVEGTVTGSTIGATNDGTAPCGQSATSPDVWYRYVATHDCTVKFDTCGSGFDTVVSVFDACPQFGGQVLECNDDTGGACGLGSTVSVNASVGSEYYIRVAGFNGAVGEFRLTATRQCAPVGADLCQNAIPAYPGTFTYSSSGLGTEGSGACDGANPGPDMFFRVTATQDGFMTASTCGGFIDTSISVHAGCPADLTTFVGCDRASCAMGATVLFPVTAGVDYIIRVVGEAGASGTVTLAIGEITGEVGGDAYVGEIAAFAQFGREGDVIGCAADTPLCNVGTLPIETRRFPNAMHPFFVFNMYRQSNGRFEQIGQSWVKHMTGAAQGNYCGFGCSPYTDGTHLGVGCSDIYGAGFNALQSNMGPRTEINPFTGAFNPATSHLATPDSPPHNAVSHRLQIHDADLVLGSAPASFWVEQYTLHAGDIDHMNSIAREPVVPVGAPGGTWTFNMGPVATINGPAIDSWNSDTRALVRPADLSDGRCILRSSATRNSDGTWHYEYALYNHDLERAVASIVIPVSDATLTNIGFHAPASHDEPFSNAAWTPERAGSLLRFLTTPETQGGPRNPVRWGTLYNFRFDADRAPVASRAALGAYAASFFSPMNGDVLAPARACPADFNADGLIDGEDVLTFFLHWDESDIGADLDASGGTDGDDVILFFALWDSACAG